MSPITHFLGSWAIADAAKLGHRDRALITWCGLLPDLDGVGVLFDLADRMLGNPEAFWYGRFHHLVLHGLPGAFALAFFAALLATRRLQTFLWCLAMVHLHILGDLVGSRGPDPTDVWPIHYLGPFSQKLTLAWQGQWRLDAWPNVALTVLLIVYILFRLVTVGRSPVSMFNARANDVVAETVRHRWQSIKS